MPTLNFERKHFISIIYAVLAPLSNIDSYDKSFNVLPFRSFHSVNPFALLPMTIVAANDGLENNKSSITTYSPFII